MSEDNYIRSYIPQLDQALGGGIRRGTGLGLYGALGRGKTTLAMQVAYNNISHGRTCSFHTHDQSAEMLLDKMKAFGWDPEPYMDYFHILDFYTILAPSEDELDQLPALSLEEDLAKKLDLRLLLKRSSKEMREKLDGRLPDLLILDSATPFLMQLGYRKLYLLLRIAKQMFLRHTASIVTINSEAVNPRELNALSSLSNYFLQLEKSGINEYCINIEKSMNNVITPSIHYSITDEGICPIDVERRRTRI
jgi:KaiC/GvpD/RAD55 family RecA-like ATPase